MTVDVAVDARSGANHSWNLKSFMDSLIVELDRAQDVLAVKGLTRPVTYTVKDVDIDLRCFPVYDGRQVRFLTAQPGEDGSSALRFSLGSISAGTIRDSSPRPTEAGDVTIDDIADLDPDAKDALAAVGVRSGRDLERIAGRGVDLRSVTDNKAPDYSDLAAIITKAHRRRVPPRVDAAQLSVDGRRLVLHVDGDNLAVASATGFPYALLDGQPREVRSAGPKRVSLDVPGFRPRQTPSRLALALDPLTVVTLELAP
ncbi:hypothetical protein IU486_31205 [Streptomyces gardneri]|uniref:hypothetical protein n=1 Tax=Nocardia abscessus TaxID=120957 RepID=UPI0018950B6A|nr:hypothetical protein [Nocardia abscessus]MBF6169171.1 hypothetical protein [Streptomyces gardneri]MBF6475255.1 hypothetical protein [Nocardia abscessus]